MGGSLGNKSSRRCAPVVNYFPWRSVIVNHSPVAGPAPLPIPTYILYSLFPRLFFSNCSLAHSLTLPPILNSGCFHEPLLNFIASHKTLGVFPPFPFSIDATNTKIIYLIWLDFNVDLGLFFITLWYSKWGQVRISDMILVWIMQLWNLYFPVSRQVTPNKVPLHISNNIFAFWRSWRGIMCQRVEVAERTSLTLFHEIGNSPKNSCHTFHSKLTRPQSKPISRSRSSLFSFQSFMKVSLKPWRDSWTALSWSYYTVSSFPQVFKIQFISSRIQNQVSWKPIVSGAWNESEELKVWATKFGSNWSLKKSFFWIIRNKSILEGELTSTRAE
jgi:hypothetical protein